MTKLTLIRGIPGSGKSTIAKQLLENNPNTFHYEADMFFMKDGEYKFDPDQIYNAHKWCQHQTKLDLECELNVIVSNTFTRLKEMRPYFIIAKQFGIVPQVITCHGIWTNVHGCPEHTVQKMKERFATDLTPLYLMLEEVQKTIPIVSAQSSLIDEPDNHGHPCPYRMELFGDYETLCDCDDAQEHECAMEV